MSYLFLIKKLKDTGIKGKGWNMLKFNDCVESGLSGIVTGDEIFNFVDPQKLL